MNRPALNNKYLQTLSVRGPVAEWNGTASARLAKAPEKYVLHQILKSYILTLSGFNLVIISAQKTKKRLPPHPTPLTPSVQ